MNGIIMNELQLQALLPFIVLASASMVVILLIAFRQSHTVIQVAGFLMMCMVVFAMWYVRDTLPRAINAFIYCRWICGTVYRA